MVSRWQPSPRTFLGLSISLTFPGTRARNRPSNCHAAFNVLALGLFAISAALLYRAGAASDIASGPFLFNVAAPLVLSICGMLSTVAAGWLGWTMVQTHHVGVAPTPFVSANSPDIEELEDFEPREPAMPVTYQERYRTTIRH